MSRLSAAASSGCGTANYADVLASRACVTSCRSWCSPPASPIRRRPRSRAGPVATAPAPSTSVSAPPAPGSAATAPAPAPTPAPPGGPTEQVTLARGRARSGVARSQRRSVRRLLSVRVRRLARRPTRSRPTARAGARFSEIDEKNKAAIKTLLEEDAKGTAPMPATKKLGDYYASCMDEAAIEKAGTAGDQAAARQDAQGQGREELDGRARSSCTRSASGSCGASTSRPTSKDSTTNVTQLDAGGLGLPDRDYYLKADFKDKLDAYQQHVARMLALGGCREARGGGRRRARDRDRAREADEDRASSSATSRPLYNPTDLKELAKQTKSVDWKAYFKALGVTPSTKIIVGTPKFFAALDGLRKKLKPAQWASYFTYHLLARRIVRAAEGVRRRGVRAAPARSPASPRSSRAASAASTRPTTRSASCSASSTSTSTSRRSRGRPRRR